MKGDHLAPNSTTLKRNVTNWLVESVGLDSQRKQVKSLSVSSSCTCKNVFSMSAEKAQLCWRKQNRIEQRSLRKGGLELRQLFRLGELGDCLQLQS